MEIPHVVVYGSGIAEAAENWVGHESIGAAE
jgi:hypothetical protein